MTNHVPTLSTCQKLKAAGFPQETHFSWWLLRNGDYVVWSQAEVDNYLDEQSNRGSSVAWVCFAPLLTEVLEQRPKAIKSSIPLKLEYIFPNQKWMCGYGLFTTVSHNNPAEAAALLWLEPKEGE